MQTPLASSETLDNSIHAEATEPKRNRLRLSVAARNFGPVPVLQALESVARAGFDTCDNFPWRDANEFATYVEGLRRYDLGAGVLVVNKHPDVNALGCSLNDPADREGFLRELARCIAAAETVECSRLEVLSGNTDRKSTRLNSSHLVI